MSEKSIQERGKETLKWIQREPKASGLGIVGIWRTKYFVVSELPVFGFGLVRRSTCIRLLVGSRRCSTACENIKEIKAKKKKVFCFTGFGSLVSGSVPAAAAAATISTATVSAAATSVSVAVAAASATVSAAASAAAEGSAFLLVSLA